MADKIDHIPDLQVDLAIGPDMEQEFSQQASKYATWAVLKAQADAEVRRLEEAEELVYAQLDGAYRKNNSDKKDLKETAVKSWIRRHPKFRQAQAARRDAQHNADILKVATRSMDMRGSMLQQMGPMLRQERDLMRVPQDAAELQRQHKKAERKEKFREATKERRTRAGKAAEALRNKR